MQNSLFIMQNSLFIMLVGVIIWCPTSPVLLIGVIKWKAWLQVLSLQFSSVLILSVPLNGSSEPWSCRKVTQVNDQIIFGQPHDTTWFWRTYSAVGKNKLAQTSLKLDLMGHGDRYLSQGIWNCCCCFMTSAETCAFGQISPCVSCSWFP